MFNKKCSNIQISPRSNDKAFTLIEMIVVLGIMAFMSALLISNMHSGGESMDLTSEAQKLGGVVRQAQMMALSGKQFESSRPAYGYGVYVDSTSYKLFVNDYDGPSYLYDDGGDTVVQSFSFLDDIEVTSPAEPDPPFSMVPFSIIFTPPLGDVYASTTLPLNISLTYMPTNLNRSLRITSYGEIDVFK